MLRFYVSTRAVKIDQYIYGPQDQLSSGFKGLDIGYKIICENRSIDGRSVCEITIGANSQYSDQQKLDYKNIVLEGLAMWSVHEKTLESAKSLAELISGTSWVIEGDSISRVQE